MIKLGVQLRAQMLAEFLDQTEETPPFCAILLYGNTAVLPGLESPPTGTLLRRVDFPSWPPLPLSVQGKNVFARQVGLLVSLIAPGTASYFRLETTGVSPVKLQGKIGLLGDPTADLRFPTLLWTAADVVQVPEVTISVPESAG